MKLPRGFEDAQGDGPGDGAQIVTFYSYKGGVGRSMALANVAVMLARDYDLDVMAVDWDLEAPGLHRFFGIEDKEVEDGLVDYFYRYREILADPSQEISNERLSVQPMLMTAIEFPGGGRVRLLPAGNLSNYGEYARRATEFDWGEFYRSWSGAQLIEHLRNQFKGLTPTIDPSSRPDQGAVVLVDSRTGITDIGGICTLQLPDTVVLVFAFNDQNIKGIDHIARDLNGENPALEDLGRRPRILLLPSRKDLSEIRSLRKWEEVAATLLGPQVGLDHSETLGYIREFAVPYVPYFAYGEEIAALVDEGVELTPPLQGLARTLVGESLETETVERLRQQLEEARSVTETPAHVETSEAPRLRVKPLVGTLLGVLVAFVAIVAIVITFVVTGGEPAEEPAPTPLPATTALPAATSTPQPLPTYTPQPLPTPTPKPRRRQSRRQQRKGRRRWCQATAIRIASRTSNSNGRPGAF